jgi:hypothetical protein
MNQNNILKYLVPIVAVIVVAESVVLISRLKNNGVTPPTDKKVVETGSVKNDSVSPVVSGNEVYQISLSSDKATYKVGENGEVKVMMKGSADKSVDSVNVYVKYDPSIFEAKDMMFDKKLPAPAFSKVSTLRGLMVANFLISDPKGLSLKSGEDLLLMSFKMKALKPGVHNFEISTGKEMKESATMIVENGTSKPITFSSNKLTVNVTQ